MGTVTYYVVQPFGLDENGELIPGEPQEAQSSGAATSKARAVAATAGGAVAFSRTGDPALGEFSDATILGRYGLVPDDLTDIAA